MTLREKVHGCGVVGGAGHGVPGDCGGVFLPGGEHGFGEELEQRALPDGRDDDGTLGTVVAEAGTLPAGDGEGGDLAGGKQLAASLRGTVVAVRLAGRACGRHDRGRKQASLRLRLGSGANESGQHGIKNIP